MTRTISMPTQPPYELLEPWRHAVADLLARNVPEDGDKVREATDLGALTHAVNEVAETNWGEALEALEALTQAAVLLEALAKTLAHPAEASETELSVQVLCRKLLRSQYQVLRADFSSPSRESKLPAALLETVRCRQGWVRLEHIERRLPGTWKAWRSWLRGAGIKTVEEFAALLRSKEEV